MSLLTLCWGKEGKINISGIEINFKRQDNNHAYNFRSSEKIEFTFQGLTEYLASSCLKSRLFNYITQGTLHALVHEMSHAIAMKILLKGTPKVYIYLDCCSGGVPVLSNYSKAKKWEKIVINLAGPLANIGFCTTKLIALSIFKDFLPRPVTYILRGGTYIWILGELLLAYTSAYKRDRGDFSNIRDLGPVYLFVSTLAILSACILGILLTR